MGRQVTVEQLTAILKSERERLALALSAGRMALYELDLVNGTRWWSPEVYSLCSAPAEYHWDADQFLPFLHPEDRAALTQAFQNSIARHDLFVHEFRILPPDGKIRWISCRGKTDYDVQDRPLRQSGVAWDVTERHAAQETLHRSEKLATAGRMAATVAHEINNPLEAVVNLLFLLEREPLPPPCREYLAMAQEQLERVAYITRQSLAFYREKNEVVTVDLCQILQRVLGLLRVQVDCSRTDFAVEYAQPCLVCGNPDALLQLFSNLLRNAVEAGSTRIRVRLAPAQGADANRRPGVRILIADNGKGIERQHLAQVFQPLYTTKGSRGNGLGLWVSKDVVENHEGRIAVRSRTQNDRSGTTFSIFLPSSLARRADSTSTTEVHQVGLTVVAADTSEGTLPAGPLSRGTPV